MNCKEAEKNITCFIKDELSEKEQEKFIVHMKDCPGCMEELSIQYLVFEGLNRLEEGGTFDLRGELDKKLESTYSGILRRKSLNRWFFAAEICAIVAFAIFSQLILF